MDKLMELYSMEKPPMVEIIKEGKEIYEDDILLIIGQGYYRVTWDRDNCKFYLLPLEDYLDEMPLDRSWEIDYEVEGNIYENKDLLDCIEKDQRE